MAYFSRNDQSCEEYDFDEYDPTPYGGGYDIGLTYGRSLEPSDELCYPNSSYNSAQIDYDRPKYSSFSEPSAYRDEAISAEYSSYPRPKIHHKPPASDSSTRYEAPSSGYGSGYGRNSEYEKPESEYRSGFGRSEYGSGNRPPVSQYGSEYVNKDEQQVTSFAHGSGYRPRPEFGRDSEYRPGQNLKPDFEEDRESGYVYGQKYGNEVPVSDHGSGYGRKAGYGDDQGSGYKYGERKEGGEHGTAYGRAGYGNSEEDQPRRHAYGRSVHEIGETEGYGKVNYERSNYQGMAEQDYRKPSYGRNEGDEDDDEGRKYKYGKESHGRKKYDDDDSDDEEKKGREKYRHHGKHYNNYDD